MTMQYLRGRPMQSPAVKDGVGDAALDALDSLLDLEATVVARGYTIPPEARGPVDDEPTVMMTSTLTAVPPAPASVRPRTTPLMPAPLPAVAPFATYVPPAAATCGASGVHRIVTPRHAHGALSATAAADDGARTRWIVAGIWTSALVMFIALAALVSAGERTWPVVTPGSAAQVQVQPSLP